MGGGLAPLIPKLRITWRQMVSFTSKTFYFDGRRPLYPLNKRLTEPKGLSGPTG